MIAFLGKLNHSNKLYNKEMFSYLFGTALDYKKLRMDLP